MTSRYDKDELKFRVKKQKLMDRERRRAELRAIKGKRIQTSKLIAWVIILLVTINAIWIESEAIHLMREAYNLDALGTLITVALSSAITLILDYAVYSLKAYHETKEEEHIKLERDKLNNDSGAVG